MKNIRTKRNNYSGINKEQEIPVFPVTITYTEPTVTSMPKTRKPKKFKAKTKSGKKSKSGFHWSETQNKWINLKEIM